MGESTAAPTSLRERKKARTRAALIEVSQRLFAERGYGETTLEDISAEVEVTPQTLLRYFDSKAHLAMAPVFDAIEALTAFLENPDRVLTTLEMWQEYVTIESREVDDPTTPSIEDHVRNLRTFRRWSEHDPVLVAMFTDTERRFRELLATQLALDWGAAPDDLHVALVAGALVAGRSAVWLRWLAEDPEPGRLLDEQLAVIAYVTERLARDTAHQLPHAAAARDGVDDRRRESTP